MSTFHDKYAMTTYQAMQRINAIVSAKTVFDVEDAVQADCTLGLRITAVFGVAYDDVLTDIMLQETNGSIIEETLF